MSVGKNITIGGPGINSLAESVSGKYLYIADGGLIVFSVNYLSIIKNITMANPAAVAVTPDDKYVLVTEYNANTTVIINRSNNKIISNISVGGFPSSIAISTNGLYAYVTNSGSNSTSVISMNTFSVINTIKNIPYSPARISISSNGRYAYVSELNSKSVAVLNLLTNKFLYNINTSSSPSPRGLAISSNNNYLYVSNGGGQFYGSVGCGNMSVVSLNSDTVVSNINIACVKHLSFSPNHKYLFVTTPYANKYQIHVIFTNNNSYRNLTIYYPSPICYITDGPLGTYSGC